MKRILMLVYNKVDASSFYRASGIAPALQRDLGDNYLIDVVQWNEVDIHWQFLIKYDLIYMQRPFSDQAYNLAKFLKNFSIPVWVDYDDDLLSVPASNRYAKLYNPEARERIKEIVANADIVTVSTPNLKGILSEFNGEIIVIPNAFNDFIFKKRFLPRPQQKVILWRGTDSHEGDLLRYGDALNEMMMKNPAWQFIFLGYNPWFLDQSLDNMFILEEMDIIVYFTNLIRMSPMVVHVPLVDILFNKSKSNIAYIEAAYANAVTVAPNWPEWKKPGSLNYETDQEYIDVIAQITSGQVDTEKKAKTAWDNVLDTLTLSQINKLRIEIIKNL